MRYGLGTVASFSAEGADKRESGFQRTGETLSRAPSAEATIQAHNQELLDRTRELLNLPLSVLTEQRDNALRLLASAQERAEAERLELVLEQDKFITFLMSEHEQKLAELARALEAAHADAARQKVLSPLPVVPIAQGTTDVQLYAQLEAMKQALEAAGTEVEETRQDARRLQEERDEAIRAIDDARVELLTDVESARDECFQLETRLDEANRLLEDARDQARDEAYRFNEDLGEVRRELDERNEEIRRLRARLATHVAETKPSMPPPPAANQELERARREAQGLRQQVIEAKRELARVTRELSLTKSPRDGAARTLQPHQQPRPVANAPRPQAAPETRRLDPKAPGRRVTPLGFFGPTTKRD